MANGNRPNLEEIFSGALTRRLPAERAAYLDGACRGDPDLRARVDARLAAHEDAQGFLEESAVGAVRGENGLEGEGPGSRIGPYKILQLIGEGGFGVVYMAEQEEPVRRKVALKIIKLGMDTKRVIARFEAERQALAMTDHPNIARVLDAGATETGRPYFVMELVRGVPLNQYCDKNHLTTRARVELFVQICRAIQHAHHKGIIHRDLKPSNVLVTLHDGTPVPKVIDFGIARATNRRLTEKTLFTEYRQIIGTPEYMSPEQAEMSGLDIDTRSDIYSLGVILYELLTGTTPLRPETIREAGWGRLIEVIREYEPPTPSTRLTTMGNEIEEIAKHRAAEPAALPRLVRGDLDWIVMKALEKDRTRRYATANELAEDVLRSLRQEPVLAGPPRIGYKLRKFVARHRVGVLAGTAVATALLLGLLLASWGLVKARREADRSQRIADFLQSMLASTDPETVAGTDLDVRSVIATAREVFGDDHATVAATLASRAVQLQNTGNLDAAEPLLRESLRIWREHGGADHPNVAMALGRLGSLLRMKGDDRGAEEVLREAARLTEHLTGPDRAMRVLPIFELASVLQNKGEFDEAVSLMRESLEIVRATTPNQRLRIALVLNALANAYVFQGDLASAAPIVDEVLEAFTRALPSDSRLLAKVNVQVGFFYIEQAALDAAESCFREAIRIYRTPGDPSTVDCELALKGIGKLLTIRDDRSVEFAAKREAFADLSREMIGEQAPLYVEILLSQADHLLGRGIPDRVLALASRAATAAETVEVRPAIVDGIHRVLVAGAREMIERDGEESFRDRYPEIYDQVRDDLATSEGDE